MLRPKMPTLADKEGAAVPDGLPPVIDTHVHIFPRAVFSAVWKWFETHAYAIRYQMRAAESIDFLLSRGVAHLVLLQYAHKPGMARALNRFMAETCAAYPGRVTGLATVFPGEENAASILQEAFDAGLKGLKLHAHVQCFDMHAACLHSLFAVCRKNTKQLVIHAGREPKSPAYRCDPYLLCSIDRLEDILGAYPDLKVCVPHLGIDETEGYRRLIEHYDNLWLDTAMALTRYLGCGGPVDLHRYRADRVMFGTDFPSIPFAWDRELKKLAAAGLSRESLARITGRNAMDFFSIERD